MKVVLRGKAGHGEVVLFGKEFGWLRRATTIRGRSTGFKTSLKLREGSASQTFAVPGPVDVRVSASLAGQTATVRFAIVTDAGGVEVWSVERSVRAEGPSAFKVRAGKLWVEGVLELVA